MKSPVLLLCIGCVAARDLDGDGVEDVAVVEGDCCAISYGADIAGCAGATDLAGCADFCPTGWLLRYNIGSDGLEDQTQFDCISFVAEADCTDTWFSKAAGINCPHYIPTAPPSPAGGLNRDLDGDGLEDAAAEGECCIGGYGNSFTNEYNCGTTMAEVQAGGCCAAGFLLRYSLQPCGEDNNGWDCVSFVDKAGCTAKGSPYQWSADVGARCPHTAAAIATPPAHHCDSALASGPFLAAALIAAVGTAL